MLLAKPVAIAAVLTLSCCAIHFVSAVYVSASVAQRELSIEQLTAPGMALPYQADTLTQVIAQWQLPVIKQPDSKVPLQADLSAFDNTLLGDTRVSLLAIYQLTQPVAVFALQKAGKPIRYVRLNAGDSDADITLQTIAQRSVTLSHSDKQASLRLFTPLSAVTE